MKKLLLCFGFLSILLSSCERKEQCVCFDRMDSREKYVIMCDGISSCELMNDDRYSDCRPD